MKIAHVCPFFKPVICGVGNVVYELARRQASQGNDVYVLTSDYGKGNRIKVKSEILDNIKVKRHRYWFKLGEFATFWPSVFSTLMKIKPDVVHTHNFGHPHVLLGGVAAKITGAKHIHSTHYPWTASRSKMKQKLSSTYYKVYAAIFNRLTDETLVLTKQEVPFLRKYGIKTKIGVLSNGVSEEFFRLKIHRSKIKNVLFLGRLSQTKGVDLLARAAVSITSEGKNVKFVFAGPDEGLKKEIENICKGQKNVEILGSISEEKKMNLLRECEIFVLPSRREGLPLTLLEALAAGKVVVAAAVDGILSVVTDKENCLLFEKENIEDLKDKLKLALNDQKLAGNLSKNARLIAAKYSWNSVKSKLDESYANKIR
jgi:glycosyltransferase involved in cell wall biosynthesis